MRLYLFLWTICSYAASQQLPAPTALFPYSESLDDAGNFIVQWNYNDTHIAFEIIANTLGYVGFGISETGQMVPADVFVAYVQNNDVHYADFHTRNRTQPRPDRQQDWVLQYGYEEQTKTIIGVVRKLDTCDRYFDKAVTKGQLHLIYAYHPTDPSSLTSLPRHSRLTRGSKLVRLLVPPATPTPPILPNDTRTIDFKNVNFAVPANESSFECLVFNMSHNKVKHHIVKMEPVFNPAAQGFVRSLTLYRCYIPDASGTFVTGQRYSCYNNPPEQLKFCQEYVGGFKQGSEAMYLPENVGIGIGGEGEPNVYILAVRYENDRKLSNVVDNSGIRVSYTKSLRPNDGSFFTMGNIINNNWYQFIPPGETRFLSTAYCSNKCLNWANTVITGEPMTTVGVVFHTQSLGRQAKLRHLTQNNGVATEHKWLSHDDTFDSSKQKLDLFKTRALIQANDSLMLECTYDSSQRSQGTLGGWGKDNELCRAYVLYYPRKHLEACLSWSSYDTLQNEKKRVVGPSKTFSTLKNTDWTNNNIMRTNLRTALQKSLQMEQCRSSFQDPSFAFSYFKPPVIRQPYKPPGTCP